MEPYISAQGRLVSRDDLKNPGASKRLASCHLFEEGNPQQIPKFDPVTIWPQTICSQRQIPDRKSYGLHRVEDSICCTPRHFCTVYSWLKEPEAQPNKATERYIEEAVTKVNNLLLHTFA